MTAAPADGPVDDRPKSNARPSHGVILAEGVMGQEWRCYSCWVSWRPVADPPCWACGEDRVYSAGVFRSLPWDQMTSRWRHDPDPTPSQSMGQGLSLAKCGIARSDLEDTFLRSTATTA